MGILDNIAKIRIDDTGFWPDNFRYILRDIKEQNIDEFLKWPTVAGTMVAGGGYIRDELDYLKGDGWERWEKSITDHFVYGEQPSPFHPTATDNSIHQTHHIAHIEQQLNIRIEKLRSILEIGGGFGNMAACLFRLGFAGHYAIYDHPVVQELQRLYLGELFPGRRVDYYSDTSALIYNSEYARPDLVIAAFSLSEMPLVDRAFMASIMPTRGYFFAYMPDFNGFNNITYFDIFSAIRPEYTWVTIPARSVNSFYLFGLRG